MAADFGKEGMVELYDTTLRDGAQTNGVHFSLNDKIGIIELLDEFGVDIIEAGWNGANVTDTELFDYLGRSSPRQSRIAAFCSTYHPSRRLDSDPVFLAGTAVDVPVITLFGKSWDFQASEVLKIPLDRNLEIIAESVAYCRSRFDSVMFDAEHFFDGFNANSNYACAVVETALSAGADCIVLCDTNGGTRPSQISQAMTIMSRRFPHARFGIHGHNDMDMAVANSLTAVEHGAVQVQGTINGIGERCGNTNLCSLIPTLVLKSGYRTRFIKQEGLTQLYGLARQVAEVVRVPVSANQPYVGENAFAHKAGVHIASVLKYPRCYEHVVPDQIGHSRRLVISDQSGRGAIGHKLTELGYISCDEWAVSQLLNKIKQYSNQGYAFDKADLSLELLIHASLGGSSHGLVLEHLAHTALPHIGTSPHYKTELAVSIGGKIFFRRGFGGDPVATFHQMLQTLVRDVVPESDTLEIKHAGVETLDDTRKRAWITLLQGPPKRSMAVDSCEVRAMCLAIVECYSWSLITGSLQRDDRLAIAELA